MGIFLTIVLKMKYKFRVKSDILPQIIMKQKAEFMAQCHISHRNGIIPTIFLATKSNFVEISNILP